MRAPLVSLLGGKKQNKKTTKKAHRGRKAAMDREATRASCTEQADKTELVQANISGKIRFDNKNHRYLHPEQGVRAHTRHSLEGEMPRREAEHVH